MSHPLSRRRARAAWLVAGGADFLQVVLFPVFAPGLAAPWNDLLDVAVAVAMVGLCGWHWAFLPSFIAELVPVLTLVPTWTAAVWLATRKRSPGPPVPALPPPPGPPAAG